MRTDVKVGLICAFVVVLGLVIYFVVQQNNHPKAALAGAQTPTSDVSHVGSGAPATPATSPAATPADTSHILAAANSAAPNSPVSGGMITLPAPTTAPAQTTQPAATQPTLAGGTPGVPPETFSTSTKPDTLLPGGSMGTPGSPGNPAAPGFGRSGGFGGTPGYGNGFGGRGFGGGAYPGPGTSSPSRTSEPSTGNPRASEFGSLPSDSNAGETTYKIQAHDMLGTIAPKYHVTAKAIEAANPGLDPTRLKVGTSIKIPAPSAASPSSIASAGSTSLGGSTSATTRPSKHTAATKPAIARSGNGAIKPGSTYTVKKGDTLTTISQAAYGSKTGWRRIFRANQSELSSADDVPVGTRLEIPK